jgi:hypothetical protein
MRARGALLSVTVLCALNPPTSSAFDADHISAVSGVGNSTCGKMTDDVVRFDRGQEVYEQYIQGFLTAVNMSLPGSADFFSGSDKIAQYKFVLQYCQANPLDLVVTGVNKLVQRYKRDFPPR